jgi:hypothetical protein
MGVGKKGMSVFLSDLLREQDIDFVGLQETTKKDYSPSFFRRFDPHNSFEYGVGYQLWAGVVGSMVALGHPGLISVILAWASFTIR